MIAGQQRVRDDAVELAQRRLGDVPLAHLVVLGDVTDMNHELDVERVLLVDQPLRHVAEDMRKMGIVGIVLGVGKNRDRVGVLAGDADPESVLGDIAGGVGRVMRTSENPSSSKSRVSLPSAMVASTTAPSAVSTV